MGRGYTKTNSASAADADVDADGDVDGGDKGGGKYGEYIPSADGKKKVNVINSSHMSKFLI